MAAIVPKEPYTPLYILKVCNAQEKPNVPNTIKMVDNTAPIEKYGKELL